MLKSDVKIERQWISRVGAACFARVELLKDFVELDPRIVEMNLYPTRTGGHCLTPVAFSPAFDKWYSENKRFILSLDNPKRLIIFKILIRKIIQFVPEWTKSGDWFDSSVTKRFLACKIIDEILFTKYFHGFITRRNFKNGGAVKIITKNASFKDSWRKTTRTLTSTSRIERISTILNCSWSIFLSTGHFSFFRARSRCLYFAARAQNLVFCWYLKCGQDWIAAHRCFEEEERWSRPREQHPDFCLSLIVSRWIADQVS